MNDKLQTPNTDGTSTRNNGALAAGALLVAIGAALLIFRQINVMEFFMLFLGLAFLVAGLITRAVGFIIPAGITGGIGLGIVSQEMNWFGLSGTEQGGALFLVCFALGFVAVAVLARLVAGCAQDWALIPAAVMAAIGGLQLLGQSGLSILKFIGDFWPVLLIAAGLALVFGYLRRKANG